MMIRLSRGCFLFQYVGFFRRITDSPTVHFSSLYGPVPVGCWNAYVPVGAKTPLRIVPWFAPHFAIAAGLWIENAERTSDGTNGPFFRVSLTTAFSLPTARQLW